MPSFTRKNLRDDVPDSAAKHGQANLEARFGRSHLDSSELGVSLFRYDPGFRTPFGHRHTDEEEAYVVVSGSGRMKLDDEIVELRQWDVVRVSPEVMRAFEAGADGLELIAVGGARPDDDKGEMEPGWWTDT
jgi:mannose-6-phosphate isomerase-like protein (cupin superfamily)